MASLKLGDREVAIHIRHLAHARRMTLRVARDGSVRLSVPAWVRQGDALAFAGARGAWLTAQLAALTPPVTVAPGMVLQYRGAPLLVAWHPDKPRKPVCNQGELHIGGPAELLEQRVRRWLEDEARRLLAADLAHYAKAAGLTPPPLMLSNAQRRWGSCSTGQVIRINWRLIMAPDAVRQSVVAHEVVHLLHFDHSPRFHAALARLFPGDLAAANLWLKTEGRKLYAVFGNKATIANARHHPQA